MNNVEPTLALPKDIATTVQRALAEDIGNGDQTAQLIPEDIQARAYIITREQAILAGSAWFEEVFNQFDPSVRITWQVEDGEEIPGNHLICIIKGPARSLVTAERTALNFLQLLSGAATSAKRFKKRVKGTKAIIRDTRKTLPGLRSAQKYAVRCGGCENHRMGLHDAILIKENHIIAAGSITAALEKARTQTANQPMPIEVEVESIEQLEEAVLAGAELVLLDNFSIPLLNKAVSLNNAHKRYNRSVAKLEASGGITIQNVRGIADTGVDYIAVGTLTKDVNAIDLSMRFND